MTEGSHGCSVCGSARPSADTPVLWPGLIAEWELSAEEATTLDRREGQHCPDCRVGLRSATLATALLQRVGWAGTLASWVETRPTVSMLEINRAGQLTPWLERLPGHVLVEHPAVDIQSLACPNASWDLVMHSETLEHVGDPVLALLECRRVLAPGGALLFTIPVLPGRLTRRRDGLPPSFHGLESDPTYLVVTEYGADFWTQVCDAGFTGLQLVTRNWPDTLAFVATR